MPQAIVSPETARGLQDAIVFDVRAGPGAAAAYVAAHLEGALFADLEQDLAEVSDPESGGRHPLPAVAHFASWLGDMGVTPDRPVVVYDDQGGALAAARLWWMLRALGHLAVHILDGGMQAAQAAGWPVTAGTMRARAAPSYPATHYALPTVEFDEVDRLRGDVSARVVDVRGAARFRGDVEPIDPVAGHILGAINVPYSENLRPDGRFKSPAALRALYQSRLGGAATDRLVVHCGSGVTACHTLAALDYAGLGIPALYVGSFSEWCRKAPTEQIARGDGSHPSQLGS